MVRPERFERPTYWFVASCSIQLSYGRIFLQVQPSGCNSLRIVDCAAEGNPARLLVVVQFENLHHYSFYSISSLR